MVWLCIRSLFFLLPPEVAHEVSKPLMRILSWFLIQPKRIDRPRVGLAAGFDKNADVLDILPKLGFEFAEIGTVTPKPQGGNSRPRLFRNSKAQTLFNRMGFNNLGAGVISERLKQIKPSLPPGFQVGVNIGKNKTTPDTEAAQDYAQVARAFLDTADFYVINVSSPNTPGLRALQSIEALTNIIQAVHQQIQSPANFKQRVIPIWVKLAPELQGTDLSVLLRGLADLPIQGIVLTNTEAGTYIYRGETFTGGWSGKNLTITSRARLSEAKKALGHKPHLEIISVGGIHNTQEGRSRIELGASRIEIYTGWIYQGPSFPRKLKRSIQRYLDSAKSAAIK
jgi:dihydroorotate dehydrogenase